MPFFYILCFLFCLIAMSRIRSSRPTDEQVDEFVSNSAYTVCWRFAKQSHCPTIPPSCTLFSLSLAIFISYITFCFFSFPLLFFFLLKWFAFPDSEPFLRISERGKKKKKKKKSYLSCLCRFWLTI